MYIIINMIKQYSIKYLTSLTTMVALCLMFCSLTAWADSRSATVRISCTVLPMIEMTQKDAYRLSECILDRDGRKVKLVSITAL